MKKLLISIGSILILLPCFATTVSAEESQYPLPAEIDFTLTSDYIYLFDYESNQVLYEKNQDMRMYPASMTKMMTEILAWEALNPEDTILITEDMLRGLYEANATMAGFSVGQTPTVLDCLYGAALPSGADAVNALAFSVSGSLEAFVSRMNEKAREIGMENTNFVNATGLFDENHYSTAKDIGILMQYCLRNPLFHQLISTPSYTMTTGTTVQSTFWKYINQGTESYSIPGFEGAKTGYTTNAGSCLSSTGEINGIPVILVTGHSMVSLGHIQDAETTYQWLNESYAKRTILTEGDLLKEVSVKDTIPSKTLRFTSSETISMDLPIEAELVTECNAEDLIYAPIQEGDSIGSCTIHYGDQVLYTQSLIATESISRNFFAYFARILSSFITRHPFLSVFYLVVILFLLLIIYRHLVIARKRRLRKKRRLQKAKKKL